MRRLAAVLVLLLPLVIPATSVSARDTGGSGGRVPRKNFSFVHGDTDWVRRSFLSAMEAAARKDWIDAIRTLQQVIETRDSRERDAGRSPYLRAVEGEETYEGAHVVAAHTIARFGDEAMAAYQTEFGGTAWKQLERATDLRDLDRIAAVADRYLLTESGRAAALLLVDLALERGDRDAALGWLETLEDLEDVSAESEERLAPWRRARLARHAHAIARDTAAAPAVLAALESAPPGASSLDVVPHELRRAPPPPATWSTTGGDATRGAVPPSVGAGFAWAWSASPFVDTADPETASVETTSPWHPPRAVTTARHVFVSDGMNLHVFAIADGRALAVEEYEDAIDLERDTGEDPRLKLGLLEGHALTVVPEREAGGAGDGYLIYAAVPDGRPWPITSDPKERRNTPRDDRIQAFHWDGTRLAHRFTAGGAFERGGLDDQTRMYGAPVLYAGSLWVAAVRPEESTGDRWQVWLLALDPLTGALRTRTHIATGDPVRRGRLDEVIPTSVSAARGRVVVGTSVGVVAAVSARDGRTVWAYRYDRETDPERERRNARRPSQGARVTGFSNEPPILGMDRCVIAPVDGTAVFVLTNRPRGIGRTMRCQQLAREGAVVNMSIEHVAGVVPGANRLVLVGRGQDTGVPGPIVAARNARTGGRAWEHPGPTLFALEPFGRGLVTQREVFVPTRGGIAIYDLTEGGADLGVLEVGMLPRDMRDEFPVPYGNLVPVPGRGVLAVSATTITYWKTR